jgi:hypothetical protein
LGPVAVVARYRIPRQPITSKHAKQPIHAFEEWRRVFGCATSVQATSATSWFWHACATSTAPWDFPSGCNFLNGTRRVGFITSCAEGDTTDLGESAQLR